MAKDTSLTIKVNDQQFQQFAKQFNEFVDKIKKMTDQLKQAGQVADETSDKVKKLTSSMGSLWANTKGIHSRVEKITKHITKWGTIVTGIGTLLGGGGLFGLNKIADAVMQRQRFMQGIGGGSYAGTQAALTFGKSVLDDPAAVLEGIATARTDIGSIQYRALQGVFGGDFAAELKKKPEDIMPDLMEKLPAKLKEWTGGDISRLGQVAQARGLSQFMSMPDLRRMYEHPDEFRDYARRIREERSTAPSDADRKAWDDFWNAIRGYTNTLQNELTTQLAPLARAMTPVSEGFTKLTEAFFKMPEVQTAIQTLADWMKGFAEYLKKDEAKTALQELFQSLSTNIKDLVGWIKWAIDILKMTPAEIGGKLLGRANEPADQTPIGGPAPTPGGATPSSIVKDIGNFLKSPILGGSTPAPNAPAAPTQSAGSPLPGAPPAPLFGGAMPSIPTSGNIPTSSGPGASFAGPPTGASDVAKKMVPASGGGIGPMIRSMHSYFGLGSDGTPGAPKQLGMGPLDLSNWQQNKQTSLIVKGVPSANLFLAANSLG